MEIKILSGMFIKLSLFFTIFVKINSGHNSPNSTDIFLVAEHADNVRVDVDKNIRNSATQTGGNKNINAKMATATPDSDGEEIQVVLNVGQKYDDGGYRTPPTLPPITPVPIPSDEEDVIFIKNEKEVERIGDNHNYYPGEDVISLKDVFRAGTKDDSDTEVTKSDIMFISGKNHENIDKNELKKINTKPEKHTDIRTFIDNPVSEKKKVKIEKLECGKPIDCNNTVKSVCGQKLENRQKKYRMFLNDCYFLKVNCGFKFEYNRYKKVSLKLCNNISGRSATSPEPAEFRAFAPFNDPSPPSVKVSIARTKRPSRRFMDDRVCDHPCPTTCPTDYSPQCGQSSSGKKQVFANHCEMDYNSCVYGTVWQWRPLSACVGNMKAELQQNKRWINWMQRMGLVDNTGRITLPK